MITEVIKEFNEIEVGNLVEVIHTGFAHTKNVKLRILTYGYVNSKKVSDDIEESVLEINGYEIKLGNIINFVDVYEVGDFDD